MLPHTEPIHESMQTLRAALRPRALSDAMADGAGQQSWPSLDEAVESLRKAGFVVTYRGQSALKQSWSGEEETAMRIAATAAANHFRSAHPGRDVPAEGVEAVAQVERLIRSVRLSATNLLGPAKRREPTIALLSGEPFNVLEPHASRVTAKDVIVGLSNQTRFAGQIDPRYTVGQHSVLASYKVPPLYSFDALMHDAAEFVLLDMPKPIKEVLGDYQAVDCAVDTFLQARFQFSPKNSHVKIADGRLFATEVRDVVARPQAFGESVHDPYPERIRVWSVKWTRFRFGARFHELKTGRRDYRVLAQLWAAIYLPRWIRPEWPDLEARH